MSVLITIKFPGDTAVFRQAISDHEQALIRFSEMGRSSGGLHHRFGVGDGFVLVVDEWETVEHFQQFFSDPDLQALIGQMGPTGPPEITVTEAVSSADQY
jgi:hypothetical protein